MTHTNSIMKKITFIIIIQGFLFNFIFSQSISDINRLKKQYNDIIKKQGSLNVEEDYDLDQVDGDLPLDEQIDLDKDLDKDFDEDEDIRLKFFGYDFFTAKDSILIWNNLPIPPSYLLGPGDEIIISYGEKLNYEKVIQ